MKPLATSVLLAAAGLTLAYRLFPYADGMGKYPIAMSRGEVIAKSRTLATRYGRNVDGWMVRVEADRDARTYEFLRTAKATQQTRTLYPSGYTVYFSRGPFRVTVAWQGNGRPVEFSFRDGRRPEFPHQELTPEQERQVLADFVGDATVHYRKTSSVTRGAEGHVTTWEWRDEDEPEVIPQLEVSSAPDGIRHVQARSEFSTAFDQRWVASFRQAGFRLVALPVLLVIAISLTNALFFMGLVRGHIKLGPALRMFGALMAIWAVGFLGGIGMERLSIAAQARSQPPFESMLQSLGLAVAGMGLFAAMWAVGRWLKHSSGLERWSTWDALLEGRVWRREVGRSISCGLLLGAALSAVPISLCAAGIFARSDGRMASMEWLGALAPVVLPIHSLMPWDLSGIFLLLLPLGASRLGSSWLPPKARWTIVAALSTLFVWFTRNPLGDTAGSIIISAALTAGFFAIYWGADLLAVFAAEVGYWAAISSVFFLHQPSPAIHASGLAIAGTYAALALAGVAAVIWASEMECAPDEPAVEIVAERVALENEFAMAREAQQRLLPAIPERLDGFSLAASCLPARDVGGDLYDFFRYPDGSYGMCVADVSGKGVPAALYMTMTKGILAAASRDHADLRGLAGVLNAQLYAAGRKKTFVTMALGRLDVSGRKLEYLRAGHNSILWRRAHANVSEYRKPRGVGLGLAPARLFERSIVVETLALGPGDVVVFYSDGITEAMNGARELFGEARLEAVVARNAGLDAAGLERAILGEVRAFMAGEPPHDDMTLLVLRA